MHVTRQSYNPKLLTYFFLRHIRFWIPFAEDGKKVNILTLEGNAFHRHRRHSFSVHYHSPALVIIEGQPPSVCMNPWEAASDSHGLFNVRSFLGASLSSAGESCSRLRSEMAWLAARSWSHTDTCGAKHTETQPARNQHTVIIKHRPVNGAIPVGQDGEVSSTNIYI